MLHPSIRFESLIANKLDFGTRSKTHIFRSDYSRHLKISHFSHVCDGDFQETVSLHISEN